VCRENCRMLICYKNILKEKIRSLSHQTLVLDFFKSSAGTGSLSLVLLETMIQMTCLRLQRKCILIKLSFNIF
jgi:hypothetical protein